MHATVYRCFKHEDEDRSTPYAVKVAREDDEEKILAHKNEFKMTKNLNHRNIVKSIEMFVNDQKKLVYQVMEYVKGKEIFD